MFIVKLLNKTTNQNEIKKKATQNIKLKKFEYIRIETISTNLVYNFLENHKANE